jgi:hypothetical protein
MCKFKLKHGNKSSLEIHDIFNKYNPLYLNLKMAHILNFNYFTFTNHFLIYFII